MAQRGEVLGESSSAAELGVDMRIGSLLHSSDPRQALTTAIEIIEERGREIVQLREELLAERGKVAETFRNSARRAAHIAIIEGQVASGKKREDQLEHELEKRDRMMDQVLNYRDKECASELAELRHENADLTSKVPCPHPCPVSAPKHRSRAPAGHSVPP